jgi:hypothetical protein
MNTNYIKQHSNYTFYDIRLILDSDYTILLHIYCANSPFDDYTNSRIIYTLVTREYLRSLIVIYKIKKKSYREFNYSRLITYEASIEGYIYILKWWWDLTQKDNLEFKYTCIIVDCVSEIGNLNVIKWWWDLTQKNNLEFKYTHYAINKAVKHENTDVINWWKRKGLFY